MCVVLSACGVRGQDEPERLPPSLVPSELRPAAPSTTSLSSTTGRVHLVENG